MANLADRCAATCAYNNFTNSIFRVGVASDLAGRIVRRNARARQYKSACALYKSCKVVELRMNRVVLEDAAAVEGVWPKATMHDFACAASLA